MKKLIVTLSLVPLLSFSQADIQRNYDCLDADGNDFSVTLTWDMEENLSGFSISEKEYDLNSEITLLFDNDQSIFKFWFNGFPGEDEQVNFCQYRSEN